jgi:tellurite resistance protein
MGILIVLGLLLAALGAVYRFIVENAAAIATFCVVAGSLLLLAYFFSKIGTRKTVAASAPPAWPRSAARLARRPTTPRVEARDHFGFRQAPTAGPAAGSARWVEPKESVTVQGILISGGLFYLGVSIVAEDHEIDKYVINPKLAARSSSPDVTGTSMPYWPSYAEITPAARRAFLDWMSGGRQGTAYGVGHVFLFFYGLEHRQFIDCDLASTPRMVAEVERLLSVYGESHSFRGYAKAFLDLSRCAAGIPLEVPQPSAERSGSSEIDVAVRLHLGRRLTQSRTILSEDALLWVLALPDVYLRTAAVRCFDEFVALWHIRFRTRFPEGLTVAAEGNIEMTYRAASGVFEVEIHGPHENFPDICKVATSPEPLRQLVQDCTEELDGFSRLVGRRPEVRNSVQAALLLPDELLKNPDFGAFHLFGQRLAELMGEHNRASTKMREMLELAEFDLPENGKVSPALADQLGQALDRIDVAIEPDRRFGGAAPQLDDQIFVFKAAGGGPIDPERAPYRSMKAQVEVAVLAAASDGEASSEELQRVIAGIRNGRDLSGVERARLIAFAVTIFNSPPKQARVMKRLAERSDAEREAIANAAVAVIGGADSVNPGEVKFLERLHNALGLPKERVYSELHRATPRSDEPVAITQERRETGIPIPKKEEAAVSSVLGGVKIDAGRLARTQRETEAVSELLANIFEEDVAQVSITPSPVSSAGTIAFDGLDKPHAELVELIELKGTISRSEFDQRAREMKLLSDGALERINDWSFDHFEEPLLEDGDDIVMVPHLRGRLAELRETTA